MHMALKTFFEWVINKACHLSATSTGLCGFGNDKPLLILSCLQLMYGHPSDSKTECHLLHLHEPMDRTLSIEVMLCQIEEVQQFIIANPEGIQQMSESNLIQFAVIKAGKAGLYTKALERWRTKDPTKCNAWMDFRAHMIGEYENLLLEGGGTTFGHEGYGSAYNATEADDSTSLAESIVRYAERATIAESKAADSESRLTALEIAHQTNFHQPPHQIVYYAPEVAYLSPQLPIFQPPQAKQPQHQQQPWTGQPSSHNKRPKCNNTGQMRHPTYSSNTNVYPTQHTPTGQQFPTGGGHGGNRNRNN